MIYDFPQATESLLQGDILFPLPSTYVDVFRAPVIAASGEFEPQSWANIDRNESVVQARVKRSWGILATQDCDVSHSETLSFFEIVPLATLTNTRPSTPTAWMHLITKREKRSPAWFYLPPDNALGFVEPMGIDFKVVFQTAADSVISGSAALRKGRLKPVALDHFRSAISYFFTRYAYDDWYALTRDQLAAYMNEQGAVEPFDWQR
jgi:hypothetical protein